MSWKLDRRTAIIFAISALAAAAASYGIYTVVGWLGVGILGLLVTFIAVRMELEGDSPVGSGQNAELYAASMRQRNQMSHEEKAARNAEIASSLRAGTIAKIIGVVFIVTGLGGFFLLQIRP